MTNQWNTPLRLATRHDKARERAEKLRNEAERLDAKADELARRYEEAILPIRERREATTAAA